MPTQPQVKLAKNFNRLQATSPRPKAPLPAAPARVTEAMKARLDLLSQICSNTKSVKEQMPVIATINEMTRYAINAAASSLIFTEENNTLVYKYTDCPLGKQFKQLQTVRGLGIAGQVIQNGQPLLLNNIDNDERFHQYKDEVAGIIARSVICAPLVVKNTIIGVLEVINKLDGNDFTENDLTMLTGLANSAASIIENVRANEKLLFSYRSTVQKLVASADATETTESKHSRRVAEYALIGAEYLSLPDKDKDTIEQGAILHDIGLLSVPPEVLKKRTALTKEEWNMIRAHPVIGSNLLRGIPSLNQVAKLILYHHERNDGKGYPCGLTGETIPMGARLISVADAFDSMTTSHSYRAASSAEDAIKELGKCAGTQFCPTAVKAFCMGYIKSRSLVKVRARQVELEGAHSRGNENTIWPISFGQGSRVKEETPTEAT